MRVISRTSNRAFVGLSKCTPTPFFNSSAAAYIFSWQGRDPEYRDLNVDYTIHVMTTATIMNTFPSFLHPLVHVISFWIDHHRSLRIRIGLLRD